MAGWVTDSSGLTVCEMHGTRKERVTATAFEADVQLLCPYNQRFQVIWDIYQNNVSYPDVPNCLCSHFAIEPLPSKALADNSGSSLFPQVLRYDEAILSVYYSTAEAASDKLFIETLEPTVEAMVMSPELFQWGDPLSGAGWPVEKGLTQREAPTRHIHMFSYTVQWIQQILVPDEYFNLPGSVNDALYTIKSWGLECIPETLLYTPGPSGRSIHFIDSIGITSDEDKVPQVGWDYTCKFMFNPLGWNYFYRSDKPGLSSTSEESEYWQPIYNKRTGARLQNYPVKDLKPLLPK